MRGSWDGRDVVHFQISLFVEGSRKMYNYLLQAKRKSQKPKLYFPVNVDNGETSGVG